MARRILLHVGCPKTGTSFLQGVLWANQDALADQGLIVPLTYHHHYRASLFVRDVWRHRPSAAAIEADWNQLKETVRDTATDVLVTHETLAAATAEQARFMVDALGGAETHLVVTARDLARQLPAEWQQSIKQGFLHRLDDFARDVVDRGPKAGWFWRVQDVPDVIERWAGKLPPERVHVVTVPPKGVDPTMLWSRFASVLGVDPELTDLAQARRNESLGSVEVELLRRVNEARDDRFPRQGNQRWFKDLLANDLLAGRPGKQRFAVRPELQPAIRAVATQLVAGIRASGCDVVGDLDDLVPAPEADDGVDPGQVGDLALLQAATGTLLDLLALHRERVEMLEHWRELAVWRGDHIAELEQQIEQQIERLERRRPRVLARRALGRARRTLRRARV